MKDIVDYDRGRRTNAVDAAHKLQIYHGTLGMIRWTVYGIAAVTLLHFKYPWVRRQTTAGKAFLISSFSIFGLVTNADKHLIDFERRGSGSVENEVRRRAIEDISQNQGIVASEGQIRRWVMEKKAEANIQ